jgi:lipoate-protein ligase A
MEWQLIDSGRLPPEEIMAKDALLLQQLQNNPRPILHLYDWQGDCLTYGYFTKPEDLLDLSAIDEHCVYMARRPTGGGVIFHLTDLAFSVLIPENHVHFSLNSLENYAFVNSKIAQAIRHFTQERVQASLWSADMCGEQECEQFCMAHPTIYDLVIDGKKVGGAAQRKTRWGFLHQGSLSLRPPPLDLLRRVIKKKSVLENMQKNTYALLEGEISIAELNLVRHQLKEAIKKIFMV